jgi:hypothetical protein
VSKKRKTVQCAYCRMSCIPTKEHALARWASKEMANYLRVGPMMAVHRIGQEPTIMDVCSTCNGGVLSQLDEAAKEWWITSGGATKPIIQGLHGPLGRWLGKIVYNVQRIEQRERGGMDGPHVPDIVIAWIRGQVQPARGITAWVSVFPEGHEGALNSSIAGPDSRPDRPVWLLSLHRFLFGIAWDHPFGNGFARAVEVEACQNLPAVSLDLVSGQESLTIPPLRDPDHVYKSLYAGVTRIRDEVREG